MRQQTRRRVLTGMGTATSLVLAGCIGDNSENGTVDNGDESEENSGGDESGKNEQGDQTEENKNSNGGEENGGSTKDTSNQESSTGNNSGSSIAQVDVDNLEWTDWVPADAVTQQTDVSAVDTSRAFETLPDEFINQMNLEQLTQLGVKKSDIDHFISMDLGGFSLSLTGDFNPEKIISRLGISDDAVETYEGIKITEEHEFVFTESAMFYTPSPRETVDQITGDVRTITENDTFRSLLAYVGDATLVGIQPGTSPDVPSDLDEVGRPERGAFGLDAISGSDQMNLRGCLLFQFPSEAERALEHNQEEIVGDFGADGNLKTYQAVDRIVYLEVEAHPSKMSDTV